MLGERCPGLRLFPILGGHRYRAVRWMTSAIYQGYARTKIMSKQSKKRARKRRQHREKLITVLCQDCLMVHPYTAEQMLQHVADALNAMEGVKMVIRPKFVLAHNLDGGGFVLPPVDKNGSWTVHMQTRDPNLIPSMLEGDDD